MHHGRCSYTAADPPAEEQPRGGHDIIDMTAEVAKHWYLASGFRDFPGPLGAAQHCSSTHLFSERRSVGLFVSQVGDLNFSDDRSGDSCKLQTVVWGVTVRILKPQTLI